MGDTLPVPMADERRLPSLANVGPFDGKGAAARWLAKLVWAIEDSGGMAANPGITLRAINVLVDGPAATFLDSSSVLQPIFAKLENEASVITRDDVLTVTTALKERYPSRVIDEEVSYNSRRNPRAAKRGSFYSWSSGRMKAVPKEKEGEETKGKELAEDSSDSLSTIS